jgi:hypothetical protein
LVCYTDARVSSCTRGCAGGARVGARRRGSGASNSRTLTEYSPRPACDGGDCGDAHTERCVRVWCWIERPRGRDWVCVWHGAGSREGSGGAGENGLGVEGLGLL